MRPWTQQSEPWPEYILAKLHASSVLNRAHKVDPPESNKGPKKITPIGTTGSQGIPGKMSPNQPIPYHSGPKLLQSCNHHDFGLVGAVGPTSQQIRPCSLAPLPGTSYVCVCGGEAEGHGACPTPKSLAGSSRPNPKI